MLGRTIGLLGERLYGREKADDHSAAGHDRSGEGKERQSQQSNEALCGRTLRCILTRNQLRVHARSQRGNRHLVLAVEVVQRLDRRSCFGRCRRAKVRQQLGIDLRQHRTTARLHIAE